MNNAINKVVIQGIDEPLMDISDTTATRTDVRPGKIFYLKDGSQATGENSETTKLESKEITFVENTTEPYSIPLGEGYQGFSDVTITVAVPGEVIPEWDGTLSYLNS